MPRLSPEQRQQAIGRLDAGQSVQQVSRAFGVNVTTVYRLQQRFHATNRTCDLPRCGRPRVTTARQDRHLVHQHQRDPFETAANTARNTIGVHGQPVSARTVRRRLGGQNLVNRRPARRPVLTAQHRVDRLAWAQQHAHWRHRDWCRVLCSDEKRFCLDPGDGRVRIWRRHGQRFANRNILQHDRWRGASVMIWGAIVAISEWGLSSFRTSAKAVGMVSMQSATSIKSCVPMWFHLSRGNGTAFSSKTMPVPILHVLPRSSCVTTTSTSFLILLDLRISTQSNTFGT
ncbi:hypothetical protein V1264_018480 [Littorina saxatilis]|uniref:Transposase Tc1-like domain-containing protein n=1 Tax=Littorina saxatilis TaxID=31220 RepID=A0AAN9BDN2_9CAEN